MDHGHVVARNDRTLGFQERPERRLRRNELVPFTCHGEEGKRRLGRKPLRPIGSKLIYERAPLRHSIQLALPELYGSRLDETIARCSEQNNAAGPHGNRVGVDQSLLHDEATHAVSDQHER